MSRSLNPKRTLKKVSVKVIDLPPSITSPPQPATNQRQVFFKSFVGLALLTLLFALNWTWFPLAYLKFDSLELPDFYPAYQVMNSWMGVFAFVGIGLSSQRFRDVIKRKKSL